MKQHPRFIAFLVCLSVTILSLVALLMATVGLGEVTNSGLFGICGPYGPAAGVLGCMLFGSVPLSLGLGALAGRRTYRRLTRDEQKT